MGYYRPPLDNQLIASDPYGPRSCLAYAAATAIDAHTAGRLTPTGRQVREATDDPTAGSAGGLGLHLGNIDVAWRAIVGTPLAYTTSGTLALLDTRLAEGRFILATGSYGALSLADRCQDSFTGGHGMGIHPDVAANGDRLIYDPLCGAPHWMSRSALRAYLLGLAADGSLDFGWTTLLEEENMAIPLLADNLIDVTPGAAFWAAPGQPLVVDGAAITCRSGCAGVGTFGLHPTVTDYRAVRITVAGTPYDAYVKVAATTNLRPRIAASPADCSAAVEAAVGPLEATISELRGRITGIKGKANAARARAMTARGAAATARQEAEAARVILLDLADD